MKNQTRKKKKEKAHFNKGKSWFDYSFWWDKKIPRIGC